MNQMEKGKSTRINTGIVIVHPRLPNGFGTIRYLGPGRRYPYAVHPPLTPQEAEKSPGRVSRRPALCYVMDWFTGLAVLACWNSGMYHPGMEQELDGRIHRSGSKDLRKAADPLWTIGAVWEAFHEWKFGENAARTLSPATEESYRMVSRKLAMIWDRRMEDLTIEDLQQVVNNAGKKITMVSKTRILIRELYQYAVSRGYCARDISQYVIMPDTEASEHMEPFMDEELAILWEHPEDPVVCMILIMSYSGFRIGAWKQMKTDLDAGYFQGGIKTACGKDRIVPIHSAITPLVRRMLEKHGGYLCGYSESWFRRQMKRKLVELGIDGPDRRHSPHSTRHTFSRLCESYGVRDADRKRMMGHSFGNDITNGVYGHRTLEELRTEIEKIRKPE